MTEQVNELLNIEVKANETMKVRTETGKILADMKTALSKASSKQKANAQKAVEKALNDFKQAAIDELSTRRTLEGLKAKANNEKADSTKANEQKANIEALNIQAENVLKGLDIEKAFDVVNAYQAFELDCLNQAVVIEYLDNEASQKADVCKAFFERFETEGLSETIVSKVLMIKTELVKAVESRPLYQQAIEAVNKAVDKKAFDNTDKKAVVNALTFYVKATGMALQAKGRTGKGKGKGKKGLKVSKAKFLKVTRRPVGYESGNKAAHDIETCLKPDSFTGDKGLAHKQVHKAYNASNNCLLMNEAQNNFEIDAKGEAGWVQNIEKLQSVEGECFLIEFVNAA